MTTATDEFYRDIIEGLAIYTGSALQRDVLATLTRHHAPDLGGALNKNQIVWVRPDEEPPDPPAAEVNRT